MKWLLFVPMGLLFASSLLQTQVSVSKLEVWMAPPGYDNGKCFRELFEQPDGWKET